MSYSLKGHLFMMKEKTTGITSSLTPDLNNIYYLYVIILIARYSCLDTHTRLDFYKQLLLTELLLCFFLDCMIQQKFRNMFCFSFLLSNLSSLKPPSFRGFKLTKVNNENNFFIY